MNLFPNRHAGKSRPYSRHETEIFDRAKASSAHALIASFPGYAVTPLHALRDLASELGLGSIQIKDKSGRFGLGSFKALGGAYAVFLLEQKAVSAAMQRQACVEDMKSAAWHEVAAGITVACTTDGNHGRSVAAGCRFVIFLHRHVSPVREQAIRDQGADIVHVDGNYDDAVAEADRTSARMGWHMVSDTSYEGYVRVPSDIMHGYAVMMEEIYAQTGAPAPDAARQPFTHVFLQAGAVGMAAAVAASLWQALGEARPTIVMVEPEAADCLYQSARAGLPAPASGDIDSTAMAILAWGEPSILAWEFLKTVGDFFMTIPDAPAIEAMRRLALRKDGPPIVCGESGAAGLAGLLAACANTGARLALGLDPDSHVLVFGTEGATDPGRYRELTGLDPAQLLM